MQSEGSKKTIIVVEPQCWGFEHAVFNAAVLDMVINAYPAHKIIYAGEATHIKCVKEEIFKLYGLNRIEFKVIKIPDRNIIGWKRLRQEHVLCREILREGSKCELTAMVFCSITNTGLLAAKINLFTGRVRHPTITIIHSCLSSIREPASRKPWNFIIQLKQVVALPHPRNLCMVALGNSILKNVEAIQPKNKGYWKAMDLCYLWPKEEYIKNYGTPSTEHPLQFGYLGVGSKGFGTFCRLADDAAPSQDQAQFVMVGFDPGRGSNKPSSKYIANIPDKPIPRETYEVLTRQLSYIVWTADPEHYRLTASATFLDALAHMKPGIYLKNEYIEYYFEKMGDIGYLCNDYDELLRTVKGIMSEFPQRRYQQQVENIRKQRVIFEPKYLAPHFREIVSHCI